MQFIIHKRTGRRQEQVEEFGAARNDITIRDEFENSYCEIVDVAKEFIT